MAGAVNASATNVEVITVNGTLASTKIDDNTIQFTLGSPRYASVNFKLSDNTKGSGSSTTVKHMLMIFADPDNNDLVEPTGTNKVVYSSTTTEAQIRNADILVFKADYHDIRTRWQNKGLRVTSGTKIWLAPGAVVSGVIKGVTDAGVESGVNGVQVYGRGLLYCGNYREANKQNNTSSIYWVRGIDNNFRGLPDAIDLSFVPNLSGQVVNNNVVRGIMVGDIMFHGLVTGPTSTIENVKLWGWHDNNDGFRPGNGSTVKNSFVRFVDDALYASDVDVSNTFFWPSYNGAVVTAGWNGPYNTGGFTMNNSIAIYPEWQSRSNNNGIVASQLGNKQQCTGIQIKNMKVYGNPAAIINLKPSTVCSGNNCSSWSAQSTDPGVRNVTIENLTVFGSLKEANLLKSGDGMTVRGVKFINVKITGFADRFLTNNDRSNTALFSGNNLTNSTYLDISSTTAAAPVITTDGTVASVKGSSSLAVNNERVETIEEVKLFPNPVSSILNISGVNADSDVEIYQISGLKVMTSQEKSAIDVSGLARGLYLIKVNKTTTVKFIKE